jgi:hypothetical protein
MREGRLIILVGDEVKYTQRFVRYENWICIMMDGHVVKMLMLMLQA